MLSRILVRFPLKCPSNYGNATAIKRKLIQFKIAALRQQVLHDPRNLHCIPAITTNGYTRQLLRERQFCGFYIHGHREAGENILETAKRELQEETGAIKFEIKPICVYSVTGKTRVNDTGEETFGLLYFAEITEFTKELHSEMEKVVLMDKLPENWTYPLIQPKLIEKYLQMKNFVDDTLYR